MIKLGGHVGAGADAGVAQIIKGLNEVLDKDGDVNIVLETMAGKVWKGDVIWRRS